MRVHVWLLSVQMVQKGVIMSLRLFYMVLHGVLHAILLSQVGLAGSS